MFGLRYSRFTVIVKSRNAGQLHLCLTKFSINYVVVLLLNLNGSCLKSKTTHLGTNKVHLTSSDERKWTEC